MCMSRQLLFQTSPTNSYMTLFYLGGNINCDLRDATFELSPLFPFQNLCLEDKTRMYESVIPSGLIMGMGHYFFKDLEIYHEVLIKVIKISNVIEVK